jgi:hypothetical protein
MRNEELSEIVADHAAELIGFLLDSNVEFSVVCNIQEVAFDPPLPEKIASGFKQFALFLLSGYALESADMDDDMLFLIFEAGFGSENFGSTVSVPTDAILQISVDGTVIFVNLCAQPQYRPKTQHGGGRESGEATVDKSLKVFMDNPQNKPLLKK